MANPDLHYESAAFQTAISEYQNVKQSFESIKQSLTNCIDSLREGWQTCAGDAFFKDFDDDLSPALDKYINFLAYLIESLEAARISYDAVVDQAQNLRY